MAKIEWDDSQIGWGIEIAKERGLMIPILSPDARSTVTARSLSTKPVRVGTHQLFGRTIPHLKDPKVCPGCIKGLPVRGNGYLAGVRDGRLCLIHITQQAWTDNAPLLEDDLISKRGLHVTLTRLGKAKNGPVSMRLDQPTAHQKKEELPPEFDVMAALIRIWRGEDRRPRTELPEEPTEDNVSQAS